MIVIHFPQSVKEYAEASVCPGREIALPAGCPHPECQAQGKLIRWGRYRRWVYADGTQYHLQIQRVRCQACGRTQALLPDFLHPYRHYALCLMQLVMGLYLWAGLGFGRLWDKLPPLKPARTTVREWVRSFAYGAGYLLLDVLRRFGLALSSEVEQPGRAPAHLNRSRHPEQRRWLKRSYQFWRWGEWLYAWLKEKQARLLFSAAQLCSFLLHWLQTQYLPPRLFWSPDLETTPTVPYLPNQSP